MMLSDVLTTVGLGLDLVGAGIIFWFVFTPVIHRTGSGGYMVEGTSHEDAARLRQSGRGTRLGLVLLAVGFILQMSGVWA